MRSTSYSDLRKNLAAALDSVTEDHAPVLITRDRGKPAAVLISVEDFASYEETAYLLRSPKNAKRLNDVHRRTRRWQGQCAQARRMSLRPSLRAQRSNPSTGTRSASDGSLRRCAPRDDDAP
ncbi:MAG: type II toxin-antitoxin system prevent-host-death family antitoxin [Rhodoblastus sp.]